MPEPFFKQPREYDATYLAYIRKLACCVCGNDIAVEAHHPRIGSTLDGGRVLSPGSGQKASDRWALPLCGKCHRDLHAYGNEREFWASLGIDPFALALRI